MVDYVPLDQHRQIIDHLQANESAAVWAGMGSGKTGATATVMDALVDDLTISRWLVVGTPRIAAKVWKAEFEKWDHLVHFRGRGMYHITADDIPLKRVERTRKGQKVKLLSIVDPKPLRAALLAKPAVVYTIHYDLVPRLAKLFGHAWPFDGVVLDESSMVAETSSQRSKSLRHVRAHIKRLYQLTGTPASNGIEKIFSQMQLVDGGERAGRTLTEFRHRYLRPKWDEKRQRFMVDPKTGQVYKWEPVEEAIESLYTALSDVVLRIPTSEYEKDHQPLYNTLYVDLPKKVQKQYEELEKEYLLEVGETVIESPTAAAMRNKLLQICSGFIYDEERQAHLLHEAKLDALEELVESTGTPILLAYWFKPDRERIKARFPFAVDLKDDPDFEENWNAGNILLGMVQPASGGHGLNLQYGGHTACWFGPIWNLELYLQFNKRLDRPGQQHQVTIHHLVVDGSVESDVVESLDEKNLDQDTLMAEVHQRAQARLNR